MINDNEIYLENDRLKTLDDFTTDIEDIFIQHLAYIFYLKSHYMMSSSYVEELEMGRQPDDSLLQEVAPFIQDTLIRTIKVKKAAVFQELKAKTGMTLE